MSSSGSMFEIDGMVPVKIRADRESERIARPKCECGVGCRKMERIGVLPQTVDIRIIRQAGLDSKILRLENERVRRRVEEHLFRGSAVDGE